MMIIIMYLLMNLKKVMYSSRMILSRHILLELYNINNGYTVFVQVTILGETDEYYIVESGEKYGLSVYDHIVLDSSKVKENQIIFQ